MSCKFFLILFFLFSFNSQAQPPFKVSSPPIIVNDAILGLSNKVNTITQQILEDAVALPHAINSTFLYIKGLDQKALSDLAPKIFLPLLCALIFSIAAYYVTYFLFFHLSFKRILATKKEQKKLYKIISFIIQLLPYLAAFFTIHLVFHFFELPKNILIFILNLLYSFFSGIILLKIIKELAILFLSAKKQVSFFKDSYRWLKVFIIFSLSGYLVITTTYHMGTTTNTHDSLMRMFGFIIATYLITYIISHYYKISKSLADRLSLLTLTHKKTKAVLEVFVDILPFILILSIGVSYITWNYNIGTNILFILRGVFFTLLLAIVARYLDFHLLKRIQYTFPQNATLLHHYIRSYTKYLRQLIRFITYVLFTVLFCLVWKFNPLTFFFHKEGQAIIEHLISISFICLFSFVFWESLSITIQYFMTINKRQSRLQTLLPFVQTILKAVILVITLIMILAHFKLNITPILASLGVLGLAVSFGAQSLMKDFITGLLIITEDSLNIGERVTISSITGRVEAITLRTVHLRDHFGHLQIIPFHMIDRITNQSRHFISYTITLDLNNTQPLKPALKTLEAVGKNLAQDEKLKPFILSPLKVFGVTKLNGAFYTVTARLKLKPESYILFHSECLRILKEESEKRKLLLYAPFPSS